MRTHNPHSQRPWTALFAILLLAACTGVTTDPTISSGEIKPAFAAAVTDFQKYSGPFEDIDIGGGYTTTSWHSSGFAGWENTLIPNYATNRFTYVWDVSRYGFLCRTGLNKVYKKISQGNPNAYAVHRHQIKSAKNGAAATGLYGFFYSPKIEFYIVEDWFGAKPTPTGPRVGSVALDDRTYDVYHSTSGNYGNWHQWWSIRQETRTNGTISFMSHFKKWQSLGMEDATMLFIDFYVETGWGNSVNGDPSAGQIDYKFFSIIRP